LLGANYWNAIVGWLGVFLIVGGVVAFIVLYVYHALGKQKQPSTPTNENPPSAQSGQKP
jgi:uncharacterized membrane protein